MYTTTTAHAIKGFAQILTEMCPIKIAKEKNAPNTK